MMGNRGAANGTECDAFSRRARHLLCWRRGELRRVKRQFSKRQRKAARLAIAASAEGKPPIAEGETQLASKKTVEQLLAVLATLDDLAEYERLPEIDDLPPEPFDLV
jgi:hypothetical protein